MIYHNHRKSGLARVTGRFCKEVVIMNQDSVNSILEDLEKIKDYSAMADISQENISRLFSEQLRSLPYKRKG
ncbi:MAG: hypothetical protein QW404_02630 [Candidatus Nanoarchaeia archaeon]